jgi:hypothetical protein
LTTQHRISPVPLRCTGEGRRRRAPFPCDHEPARGSGGRAGMGAESPQPRRIPAEPITIFAYTRDRRARESCEAVRQEFGEAVDTRPPSPRPSPAPPRRLGVAREGRMVCTPPLWSAAERGRGGGRFPITPQPLRAPPPRRAAGRAASGGETHTGHQPLATSHWSLARIIHIERRRKTPCGQE